MRAYALVTALLMSTLPVFGQPVPLPRERPPSLTSEDGAVQSPGLPEVEADAGPGNAIAPPPAAPSGTVEPEAPARTYQTQCPAVLAGLVEAELLPPIQEGSCGERTPWSVTGIRLGERLLPLSSPASLSCEMATALPDWAEMVDGYLQASQNTELAEITVGTSFLCRDTVGGNDQRISEHGFANALDVAGFKLSDGTSIAVEADWPNGDAPAGRFLRFAHDAACSLFATTLGPEANKEHQDHFHLDMGCHGNGCMARLCQ
jgi:hypothetical protein